MWTLVGVEEACPLRAINPWGAGAVDPEGASTPCTALHPALKRTGAKLGKAKQKRSVGQARELWGRGGRGIVPQEHSQTIRCCVFSSPCGTLVISYKYSTRDGATACLCACRDRFRSGNPRWMLRAPQDPSTSSDLYASSRVSSEDRGAFCLTCRVRAHMDGFLACAYKWEFLIGAGMRRPRLAEPRGKERVTFRRRRVENVR